MDKLDIIQPPPIPQPFGKWRITHLSGTPGCLPPTTACPPPCFTPGSALGRPGEALWGSCWLRGGRGSGARGTVSLSDDWAMHFHPNWNEWWYILQGEWEWNIEGIRKIVKKGDVAFIKRNKKHKITAKGNEMAIRLAVSRSDVDHVYVKEDY